MATKYPLEPVLNRRLTSFQWYKIRKNWSETFENISFKKLNFLLFYTLFCSLSHNKPGRQDVPFVVLGHIYSGLKITNCAHFCIQFDRFCSKIANLGTPPSHHLTISHTFNTSVGSLINVSTSLSSIVGASTGPNCVLLATVTLATTCLLPSSSTCRARLVGKEATARDWTGVSLTWRVGPNVGHSGPWQHLHSWHPVIIWRKKTQWKNVYKSK